MNLEGRTVSGQQPYGGPANFYATHEGRSELVLYPAQRVRTILHELGHVYNLRHAPPGRYAHVYLDPQMQSFLDAAGWQVLTDASQLPGLIAQSQVAVALQEPPICRRRARSCW